MEIQIESVVHERVEVNRSALLPFETTNPTNLVAGFLLIVDARDRLLQF